MSLERSWTNPDILNMTLFDNNNYINPNISAVRQVAVIHPNQQAQSPFLPSAQPRARPRRAARTRKPPPPPRQKATVKSLANDEQQHAASGTEVEDAILARIKKCIERANHPNTNESEARAALLMSTRLMQHHNVTHADLLARDEADNVAQYGGRSTVLICSTKDGFHAVIHEGFVDTVAHAMEKFFDCKSYSTKMYHSIEWTFYGIAENTVAAAMAFEMVHNLILEWARDHRGRSASYSYCRGVADGLYETAKKEKRREEENARRAELDTLAEREQEEQEQRQRELDRLNQPAYDVHAPVDAISISSDDGFEYGSGTNEAKLNVVKSEEKEVVRPVNIEEAVLGDGNDNFMDTDIERGGSNEEDSDDDDDGDNSYDDTHDGKPLPQPHFKQEDVECIHLTMDLDDALEQILKSEHVSYDDQPLQNPKPEVPEDGAAANRTATNRGNDITNTDNPSKNPIDSLWKSEMQLVQFRQTAEKVAQDFLERANIKLRTRKRNQTSVRDRGAYKTGRKDSKKIDVRQRRIEQ